MKVWEWFKKLHWIGKTLIIIIIIAFIGSLAGSSNTNKAIDNKSSSTKANIPTTPSTTTTENNALIPGITAADIKLNLKNWKIEFTGPRPVPNKNEYLDDGKANDPDTGVELSSTITTRGPTKIEYVIFRTIGDSSSLNSYKAITESFLSYCATLPYDGSEPQKAKDWVSANLKTVKPGKPVLTVIGAVEYQLSSGSELAYTLSMKPKS